MFHCALDRNDVTCKMPYQTPYHKYWSTAVYQTSFTSGCNISHLIYYTFWKFVFDYNFWFLKHFQKHSSCAVYGERRVLLFANFWQKVKRTAATCTRHLLNQNGKIANIQIRLNGEISKAFFLWVGWGVWYCMSWMCTVYLYARGCKRSCTKFTVRL